jgi:hypothetical protein
LVIHRPVDHHGDGYVHQILVELHDEGISAHGSATLEGQGADNLRDFLVGLARDWRGWPGVRSWTALEHQMVLEAEHDGTGHVTIAITLWRSSWEPDAWSARIVLTLEAGEQLQQLADAAKHHLRPSGRNKT